jgi:hypothetical protein
MKKISRHINFGLALGLAISFDSVTHIPSKIQPGVFERNAAPQLIALLIVGIFAAAGTLVRRSLAISRLAAWAIFSILIATSISLLLSDSPMTSFIGDTGRYAGVASLWALISIALAAATLKDEEFIHLLIGLSMGIVLLTLLGFLQSLEWISLPTGGGVGSTLGNLDFLSAWIGTTLLLIFITSRELRNRRIIFVIYLAISIFILWKIDAKQGFLDLLIVAIAVVAFQLLRKLDLSGITRNGWKAVATFILLLWSEAIYLIPMLKLPIPGVGDDPQVAIRSDFWFSAAQMFTKHIGFGVGPDNYGSYYEKFRSLNSVKKTEFVLANDAHSSMMQTFATVGIFAAIAFLLLALAVAYATIDLYWNTRNKSYLLILLAFFTFYTNSLISPITLPHKAIFWALAGYLLGAQARHKLAKSYQLNLIKVGAFSLTSIAIMSTALLVFAPIFTTFNSALSANNNGQKISYRISSALPCVEFSGAQIQLVEKSGGSPEQAAKEILSNHPRCLDALRYMAAVLLDQKNFTEARPYIYQLLDVAPARQEVVRMAAIYAMATNDESLKDLLTSQGLKLGILTQSALK